MHEHLFPLPVIGVCGFKKSGKTTMVEKLASALSRSGLRVGFIKHDAHSFEMDIPGKDTFKIFEAGACFSAINNQKHGAIHFREQKPEFYLGAFLSLLRENDIVLVEGYKRKSWPKLWLSKNNFHSDCPAEVENVIAHLAPCPAADSRLTYWDQIDEIERKVRDFARTRVRKRPVMGGILIGGQSTRMGRPKTLLPVEGKTLVEKVYNDVSRVADKTYFLGKGPVPDSLLGVEGLPDLPYLKGPLSGIMAAHRFHPDADWLIVAVDMPKLNRAFLSGLIERREPGYGAAVFLIEKRELGYGAAVFYDGKCGAYEPLCALYSPELLVRFERALGSGEYSTQDLLKMFEVKGFGEVLDRSILENWNSPEDLANYNESSVFYTDDPDGSPGFLTG
jgi:molybdopterin-guanine dinucleotide biosynthesis protein MobB